MTENEKLSSNGKALSGKRPSPGVKRILLIAGIASVVIYGLGDLVSGLLYRGYSYRDQAISELSAFGSPVRPLMMTVILIHGLLVFAFGLGVWRAADRKSLRIAGLFLMGAGVIGFPTHTVFAMSSRWLTPGFNDTMHIALSMVFSLFVFAAIVLSAVAYRGWFRVYSIVTLLIIVGFGLGASMAIRGIAQNSTPWAGASSGSTLMRTSLGWSCLPCACCAPPETRPAAPTEGFA